jgi:hypothetical protein
MGRRQRGRTIQMSELELVIFNKHIPPGKNNLLRGLSAISFYLTSDPTKEKEVEAMINNHKLPVICIGEKIIARKASLSRWYSQQLALAAQKSGKRPRRTRPRK